MPLTLQANAMAVGSWHLTGVGPTLAMALARCCTYDQFPFVLSYLVLIHQFVHINPAHLNVFTDNLGVISQMTLSLDNFCISFFLWVSNVQRRGCLSAKTGLVFGSQG
jgi:hypothetical protein